VVDAGRGERLKVRALPHDSRRPRPGSLLLMFGALNGATFKPLRRSTNAPCRREKTLAGPAVRAAYHTARPSRSLGVEPGDFAQQAGGIALNARHTSVERVVRGCP